MELKNGKRGVLFECISLAPNSIPVYTFLLGFMFVADGFWFGTLVVSTIYYSWTRLYRVLLYTVGISGRATSADITIGRGIVSKRYISSKWSSVSGVEIDDNLLLRGMRRKRMKIHFAGSSLETAVFCCLPPDTAYAIRDTFQLVSGIRDPSELGFRTNAKDYSEDSGNPEFMLSGLRLGVAALSSGRFLLVIPFLLSLTNFLGISLTGADSFALFVVSGGMVAGSLKVFVASLTLVSVGIAFFIFAYHGWSVYIDSSGIRISYGSFSKKDTLVHSSDVQAVFLTRTIAYSAVKSWRVSVQCRSSDDGSRVRLISPMVRDSELDHLLQKLGVYNSATSPDSIPIRSIPLASHCRVIAIPSLALFGLVFLFVKFLHRENFAVAGAIISVFVVFSVIIWATFQSARLVECPKRDCIFVTSGLFRFRVCVFYLNCVDSWRTIETCNRIPAGSFFILGFNVSGIKNRSFVSWNSEVSQHAIRSLEGASE